MVQATPDKFGWRHKHHNILVPHLMGLVKPVTPCVYTQNANFFGGIFFGPQEGRICAATSFSIPLLGNPEKASIL